MRKSSRLYRSRTPGAPRIARSARYLKFSESSIRTRYTVPEYPRGAKPVLPRRHPKRQAKIAEADPEHYKNNNAKAYEKYKSRSDEDITKTQEKLYPDNIKSCKRCQADKDITEFRPLKNTTDVLTRYCAACENDKDRIRGKKKYESHWKANNIPFECYICQGPYEQSDHVYPSILGGSDEPHNRLPICAYHNGSKNGTPLETWLSAKHPELLYDVMKRVTEEYNIWPYPPTITDN